MSAGWLAVTLIVAFIALFMALNIIEKGSID